MVDRLNPAEKTAAESDYAKKFDRQAKQQATDNTKKLQEQEAAGNTHWKTVTKKDGQKNKKKFRFAGRRAGRLHHASVFVFIFAMLGLGVWYTSIFAPNIILVNIKEMYTNDLADSTIALDTFYKGLMSSKINRSNCGEPKSIKCKLTTMSRAQKMAFEKQGFTVLGSKVVEDNRDDGTPGNELPEQRLQVSAILPPAYMNIVNSLAARGMSLPSNLLGGNLNQLGDKVSNEINAIIKEQTDQLSDPKQYMPIVLGDMLFLYASLSDANKAQVYSVFDPKASFYMDARFTQRLKSKYNLTKTVTTVGTTEQAVNRSFDNSVRNGGGIDVYGRPDPNTGVSLGSLSSPVTLAQLQLAARTTANQANSYVELQCAWYSLAKSVTNNAKTAKATTLARFAMQYLKAADSIKAGNSDVLATQVLSSKLAQSTGGGYGGSNATDSSLYRSIVYNDLPIPSVFGLLYYLNTFDLIAALAPAWSQIMTTAAAVGAASGAQGSLLMPPANLTNTDRQYCLSGETTESKTAIKNEKCAAAITASAPPAFQAAVSGALKVGDETCPPTYIDTSEGFPRPKGEFIMTPSLKATDATLTAYVAGIFGANVMAWANVMSLLFTSNTKGVAASDAIFAGTGEILGDMAMSRGMMPSNAAYMAEYLAQKESVEKDYADVARYNARQNPLDVYNKYSFLGSIVGNLSPSYDSRTPLLSTVNNVFSVVGSSIKQLDPAANAFYYLQPAHSTVPGAGLAKYLLRLNCPDPEYLALGIMADTACNVRYSMSRLDLMKALTLENVIDYMTQPHPDAYQEKLTELEQRLATADFEGNQANIDRQIANVTAAMNTPFIDRITGRPTAHSEYEKFLEYCVNRQDPWGRSAMAVRRVSLPENEVQKRLNERTGDLEALTPDNSGYPYEKVSVSGHMAVSEGAQSDQDWYTGKKCVDPADDMISNFRAYTMFCSIDGSLSGAVDCTYPDNSAGANYSNSYFTSNNILYTSWN